MKKANMEQLENPRITSETEAPNSLETSVRQLSEQFGAFRQSYSYDIDKLTGLLLEVKSALTQRRNASLWHRMRMALTRKTEDPGKSASDTSTIIENLVQSHPENMLHIGKGQ
jgi:hypothetical protein